MSEIRLKQQASEEVVSEGQRSNWSQSVERIENALHRNYYTIAYSIVIVAVSFKVLLIILLKII